MYLRDMTYREWKKSFVDGRSGLTEDQGDSKIRLEGDRMSLEYQRYDRGSDCKCPE